MATRRGTTWRDAWGEFLPAFLTYAVPAFVLLVTGIGDEVVDTIEAGRTPDLQFGAWVSALVSILVGGIGAGAKVLAYRFTTTRGVS